MIANYHTHTWRCNHASGTEREYIEKALEAGLKTLGFSDHSPHFFPAGFTSGVRMKPEGLDEYTGTILSLREEYKDRIAIPLGLEMEYYPRFLPELLSVLRDRPVDYLICGQHFIPDEVDGWHVGGAISPKMLEQYCDQIIDAIQSGLYTYIAHPDMIRFAGEREVYRQQVRRICREARDCGMPLEINLLGVLESRNYPYDPFWQTAAEENCHVVIGRDAHKPESMVDYASENKALAIVEKYGLHLLPEVPLRKF